MKKILFIIVILSSLTNTIMATNDETKLIVWAKDGTKVTYVLNEKPLVTFTETDLVIHSNGIEMNYPLTSMARFTFEKGQNTGVRNINSIESHISFDGNLLCFHNLSMNSNVSLYSYNGNLIFKDRIPNGKDYTLPLSNLDAGIYIVTINGMSYKFAKK